MPGPLRSLALRMGGGKSLAAALGVGTNAIWLWNVGETIPKLPTRLLLAKFAKIHGLPAPFALDIDERGADPRKPRANTLMPLARKLGGLPVLAKALRVPYERLPPWNRGQHVPDRPTRARLAKLAARYELPPPFPLEAEKTFCGRLKRNGPLAALTLKMGNMAAVSKKVGESVSMLSRWNRRAAVPNLEQRHRLASLAKRHDLPPPFALVEKTRRPRTEGPLWQLSRRLEGGFRAIAVAVGVTVDKVQHWSDGRQKPPLEMRERLAHLAETCRVPPPFDLSWGVEPIADGPLNRLAREVGGLRALAAAVGVTIRTGERWNDRERVPGVHARKVLTALAKKHGVGVPLFPPTPPQRRRQPSDGPMKALVVAVGGTQKLGATMRVGATRISEWNVGETLPTPAERRLLARLAKKHGLPPPFPLLPVERPR